MDTTMLFIHKKLEKKICPVTLKAHFKAIIIKAVRNWNRNRKTTDQIEKQIICVWYMT